MGTEKSITVFDVAIAWGARADEDGGVSGAEFARLGLPLVGGCEACGATIAAYNACPSRTGFLRCAASCIDGLGFATVAEFEAFDRDDEVAPDEPTPPGAWEEINAYTQDDGSIEAVVTTNDNLDRGGPSEYAQWTVRYRNREEFDRHAGRSRTGISGIRVSIWLDGEEVK